MMTGTILVLGARNLGGAILDHFLAQGWNGAAVARSDDTLAAVRDRGALAIAEYADAGFDHLVVQQCGDDQERLIALYADEVLSTLTAPTSRPPA